MSNWKVILGFPILALGIIISVWAENYVISSSNINEAMDGNINHVDDINTINQKYEGKLIHINGNATTDELLEDKIYNVQKHALCLASNIYWYQWVEVRKSTEGRERGGVKEMKYTYSYHKEWSPKPIDSFQFQEKIGHINTSPFMPAKDSVYAEHVHVGAYQLNAKQTKSICKMMHIGTTYDEAVAMKIRKAAEKSFGTTVNVEDAKGEYFVGTGTFDKPEIGDVKIGFSIALPIDVTIVGQQKGNSIKAFVVGDDSVSYIKDGTISAEKYMTDKVSDDSTGIWCARIFALIFLWWGLYYIFPIVLKIKSLNPLLADFANVGSFLITLALSLVIICIIVGIAWLGENILVSIICFGIVAAIIVALFMRHKKNKKQDLTNSFGIDDVEI